LVLGGKVLLQSLNTGLLSGRIMPVMGGKST
jgi:hypothetical protein